MSLVHALMVMIQQQVAYHAARAKIESLMKLINAFAKLDFMMILQMKNASPAIILGN